MEYVTTTVVPIYHKFLKSEELVVMVITVVVTYSICDE